MVCWLAISACSAEPATQPVPPVLRVHVQRVGDIAEPRCETRVDGRVVTSEELLVLARGWEGTALIVGDGFDTPYRCVGGAIFALQRAGVQGIGFVAEPPGADAEGGEGRTGEEPWRD